MLKKYIYLPKIELGKNLQELSTALIEGRFSVRRDLSLIFLCGANQCESVPSARRSFLKKTIERKLPHARVVYAEAVMDELAKHGKTKNLLDIEHQISQIADRVVIVLESFSSFCELGAFAHNSLRDKLIVINDSHFKTQRSFINLGPLEAITEDVSKDRVLWYPMRDDGIHELDAIGLVIPEVIENLHHRFHRAPVHRDTCIPNPTSQISLFFLHDLIYLCGPLTHAETIEIYKKIFGNHSFDDVKPLRGILHASGLVKSVSIDGEIFYLSQTAETFINFETHERHLVASFRRFHMKFNSGRLIHE